MENNTIDIPAANDLGGVNDSLSLKDFPLKTTPPKNRRVKGYLRFKITAGIKYWYYCRSIKTRSGHYKEKAEYIGNADAINKMKKEYKHGKQNL